MIGLDTVQKAERCIYLQLLDTTIMTKYGDNDEDFRRYLTALRAYIMQEQTELPLGNLWRVQVYPSGTFRINDFTMPSSGGIINKVIRRHRVPQWILDAVAVLQIVDEGADVPNVGKRLNENVFYVIEPMKE